MSIPTVVIELGNSVFRVGFAGESCPRFSALSAMVASEKHRPDSGEDFYRALLRQQWLETLSRILYDCVQVRPKECRVLLLEKLYLKKEDRDSIITVLLRDLQVSRIRITRSQ